MEEEKPDGALQHEADDVICPGKPLLQNLLILHIQLQQRHSHWLPSRRLVLLLLQQITLLPHLMFLQQSLTNN